MGINLSKKEVLKYNLVNYFDVWGNAVEGWEVNNLCSEGIVEITENATKSDLIQALIDKGFFLDTVIEKDVEIQNDFEMIEFFVESNMYPICRLELIRQ
jgi:hypothetical protein